MSTNNISHKKKKKNNLQFCWSCNGCKFLRTCFLSSNPHIWSNTSWVCCTFRNFSGLRMKNLKEYMDFFILYITRYCDIHIKQFYIMTSSKTTYYITHQNDSKYYYADCCLFIEFFLVMLSIVMLLVLLYWVSRRQIERRKVTQSSLFMPNVFSKIYSGMFIALCIWVFSASNRQKSPVEYWFIFHEKVII